MTGSRIVRWKDLPRWLPGYEGLPDTLFPLTRLGDVLERRRESVSEEAFDCHNPITIRFGGSIEPRDRAEPFAGSMWAVRAGDLVFSKIDLRNGAVGLLPDELAPAVVTSEYPIYTPDPEQADPSFLALLLRTDSFIELLNSLSSGTSGRRRISPEQFEALEVPMPDVAEQRRLAHAHAVRLAEADALDARAVRTESDAVAAFEAALGLTPPPDLPRVRSRIARFAEMDRWSHEGALYAALGPSTGPASDHPIMRLGDVIADLSNGWSPQCLGRPAKEGEWGVLKVSAVSSGTYLPDENKALPRSLKPRPDLAVRVGEVLIGRANVPRLVGIPAYVHETPERLILNDKVFRVVFDPDLALDPQYLVAVLKTPAVRQQVEAAATGTSPSMKNISKPSLLDLLIPFPPLETQYAAVNALVQARGEASRRIDEASALRRDADAAFGEAVFG